MNPLDLQDRPDSLSVSLRPGSDGTEVVGLSFFGGIQFGRVGEPDVTDDGVLVLASALDLAATKAALITQRAEAKEYRGLAALLRSGLDLSDALGAARTLYGDAFQPSETLRAMTYFGDGDLSSLSEDDRSVLIQASAYARRVGQVPLISRMLGNEEAGHRQS